MMLAQRVKQVGFSAIEVLIALVVAGIGIVSLSYLHAQISEETGITYRQMESIDNAWDAMDSMRHFTTLAAYDLYGSSGSPPYTYATEDDVDGIFDIEKRVLTDNSSPAYVVVEGTSSWVDSNGVTQTDKFRTAIPRLDPTETVWYWS